jgi:hypothetical protein
MKTEKQGEGVVRKRKSERENTAESDGVMLPALHKAPK